MNYTSENRGVIQHRNRRKQIVDFSGLRFGNITPTDCDGLIEYQNKAYIFFELKYRDAKVSHGQLLAFTRIVDDLIKAGKNAVLVIAEHSVDAVAQDIDAATCVVRHYYINQLCHSPKENYLLKDFIQDFISNIG